MVKYYAPEKHLILGKVVFCEHKDKIGKLLGLSKFDGKRALHISKAVKVSNNR